MTDKQMKCGKCQQRAPWLTEVDQQWIGPCCVPDEVWDQYPGWREREQVREGRAARARANFGHAETA